MIQKSKIILEEKLFLSKINKSFAQNQFLSVMISFKIK